MLSVFKYSNHLSLCQKSVKPNEPFLTKPQFIPLISSLDTAHFRVLQLIEKSDNVIDQEYFGPYLRSLNFPKYEICSGIQQLQ